MSDLVANPSVGILPDPNGEFPAVTVTVAQGGSTYTGTNSARDNAQIIQGNVVHNHITTSRARTTVEAWVDNLELDSMEDRRAQVADHPATAGTCQWLFETKEFKSWEAQSGAAFGAVPVLVLKGKAGSGKSVLLYKALQRLESLSEESSRNLLALAFFFGAPEEKSIEKTTERLYRSLIYQFLKKRSTHPDINAVLEQFQTPQQGISDIYTLKQVLIGLLSCIRNLKVYLFLDALDDCVGDGERDLLNIEDILRFLHKLPAIDKGIRICVTTRSEAILENFIDAFDLIDVKANNQADIKTYVDAEVKTIRSIPRDLRATLSGLITQRCSNMFLWARLVIEKVKSPKTPFQRPWTERKLVAAIESFPRDLHHLYQRLLRSPLCERDEKALTLLQLIHAAVRPLTMTEIQSALHHVAASNDPEEQSLEDFVELSIEDFSYDLHDISGGLVEITTAVIRFSHSPTESTKPVPVVGFIHRSVTDFINHGGLTALDHRLDSNIELHSHLRLAALCMKVLDTPEAAVLASSAEELEVEMSFLRYACRYWTLHARKSNILMTEDSSAGPTNITQCSNQTEVIFKLFRKHQNTSVYVNLADMPNNKLLRCNRKNLRCSQSQDDQHCQDSLLVLLALEGCTKLVTYHANECRRAETCYANSHILDRSFVCAVHRGWCDTARAVWDLAERTGNRFNVNKQLLVADRLKTPLYIACFNGHTSVARFLIEKGANPLLASDMPYTLPLHAACAQGYLAVVRLLLEKSESQKKDVLTRTVKNRSDNAWTVLHFAANFGSLEIVQDILKHLDPHDRLQLIQAKTCNGKTAIAMVQTNLSNIGDKFTNRKKELRDIIYGLEKRASALE